MFGANERTHTTVLKGEGDPTFLFGKMETLLALSIAMFAGLMMSRVAKKLGLPAVTSYLVAGILIGPYCLGQLGIPGIGLLSAEDVSTYDVIQNAALGFIAFAMGNEFRLAELKKIGKAATVIAVFQALVATLFVDLALYGLHLLIPEKLPLGAVITLGAVATATAPAATLMVVKQYKAEGPLTRMLLPVVALDDVVGLMVFAVSFGVAKALSHGTVDLISVLVNPIIEVAMSLLLGFVLGLLFHYSEKFFHSNSKRMSISITFVFLAVALSMLKFHIGPVEIGFSSLLVCMMLGTVFCNLCDFSEELMDRVDKWTAPLMILFFVISGAGLEFNVLADIAVILVAVVYIIARSAGKMLGASVSAGFMKCEPAIKKYLGITLLPQAGVALGMSMTAMELGEVGLVIRNVALTAVLVYELVGPLFTKIALTKAGEIKEKPVPARVQAELAKKK